MKKWLAVLAAGAVASVVLAACSSGNDSSNPTATSRPAATTPTPTSPSGAVQGIEVKVTMGDIAGPTKKYEMAPNKFNFKVGDAATFVLTSETEFHTFTSKALGLDVEVDAKKTVRKSYTFDKAGTYKVICVPHEALGMTAEIIVG